MNKYEIFMGVAKTLALGSTCPRRSVGCVLLDENNHILSTGYNGVPRGFTHCTEESCEGATSQSGENLHLCRAVHAEQNALMQCKNIHDISVVIVTTSPCMHCMKMLLNTNAQGIFYGEVYDKKALEIWVNSYETRPGYTSRTRWAFPTDAAKW